MTQITYTNTPAYFSIEFRGHAGFAEAGKDIVCAAVSMLANELIFACEKAERNGEITALHREQDSALVRLHFFYTRAQSIGDIVELILECLQALETQYRAYVRVKKSDEVQ
ncbi:MAG: ribosomal-processing cysteine protease Prp [Clostridia bacterium]|nr:ribosomal-processing cysteine protease Prp [Clostridia bacterium]